VIAFRYRAVTSTGSAETGVIDRAARGARGAIRAWLMVLFALVVVMLTVAVPEFVPSLMV